MSNNVGEMFSYISKTYDLLNHILSFNIDKYWRAYTISYIEGDNILDVASGTGDVAIAISKKYPFKQIIGVDISYRMLFRAKEKIKNTKQIKLACCDAINLPFSDNTFDSVIIAFGIRNIKNRIQALYEFKRVLKTNGKLLILEFNRPKHAIVNTFYSAYRDYIMPNIGKVVSGNKSAYKYLSKTIKYFPDPEFLSSVIRQVGFKDVYYTPLSFGIACLHEAFKEG